MLGATLDISEARRRFNTLDRDLQERPVIYITRHSKSAFAVVDIEYLETIMETMEVLADGDARKLLEESIQDIQAGKLIDHDDLGRELGLAETDENSVDRDR